MLLSAGMKIHPLSLLGLSIVVVVIYLIQNNLKQPEIITIKPQIQKHILRVPQSKPDLVSPEKSEHKKQEGFTIVTSVSMSDPSEK